MALSVYTDPQDPRNVLVLHSGSVDSHTIPPVSLREAQYAMMVLQATLREIPITQETKNAMETITKYIATR